MKPLFFGMLLALRRVAADDDSSPRCNTDASITSQADADYIASCQTVGGGLTITNSASGNIDLHGIETIQGPFTAHGTNLTSLIASDLKTITGTLSVANNGALNQISMSNLQTVGGDIKVENNQNLKDLSFNDLDEVRGGLTISGDLNRISFSNLDTVRGQTTIHSSGTFNCSSLNSQQSEDNVFQSSYSCTTGKSNKSSSNDGLSTGAKAGIAVAVVIVTLLILFFLWLFIRRRKRQQNRRSEKVVPEVTTSPTPAPTGLATKTKPPPPQDHVERSIPRKPLSPPPVAAARSSVAASFRPWSERMSVPVSLLPGSGPSVSDRRVTSDPTLFLHHIPPPASRPPPSEMDVPMLDSGNVYEAGTGRTRSQTPVYELDGGGMSNHQQPIHRE